MTKGEQNLLLLESLIPKNEKFYVWCYDPSGKFIATSCPERERELLDRAFRIFGGMDKARDFAASGACSRPLVIGSPLGMQWALTLESERGEPLLFVVGPVFYTVPIESHVRLALRPFTHRPENARWANELCRHLPELPVMSYAVFTRYLLMVHNTLTAQQLGLDALDEAGAQDGQITVDSVGERDRNKVYLSERAMLQMVRNGDINYHSALQNSSMLSPGVPVQGQDPLRQAKTSVIVFTTLVSRAAMEGGLSPEIAYALGDSYIQSVENCRDSGELSALAAAMYHDFIYRVHHLRANPDYSHAVQKCCDYIELSLERKIRTSDLAALVGYTEYYLTEKFKKETGFSVSNYIRFARLERAKVLLETTDLSVREISEQLAFNTVNYFIQCFRETVGLTPAQYRKKAR